MKLNMKKVTHQIFKYSILSLFPVLLLQCKFDKILQPASAQFDQIIEIEITVSDNLVPEPNAHKGLLCMLIPDDWSFVSATYNGDIGSGTLAPSAAWADSAEACYPAHGFAGGMQWLALLSDSGYAYDDPISIDVNVKLRTGQREGCFDLAYLVTKATPNLICSQWTPLSYPHRIGIPDSCQPEAKYKTETAPDWDARFDRQSGWTGADGIYSIPLNGSELPDPSAEKETLLLFSDTFIGEVNAQDGRESTRLINNSYAMLRGNDPSEDFIDFFWSTVNDKPATVFVPDTPESKDGDWYWLMDGIAIGDSVYVYALRLDHSADPFKLIGVNLLVFALADDGTIQNYRQMDTPLYFENKSKGWEIVLGQALMPMKAESGNPDTDGYIYVYGTRSSVLKKDMVVARVVPRHITDFAAYEFWDGQQWQDNIACCAAITSFISQEFSVSPLSDGSYIAVFQTGQSVAVRRGSSPLGPFDFYRLIYDCPEPAISPNVFVYNAKAHPHLSRNDRLLISYNVNTTDFSENLNNADIYRPRFIELSFEDSAFTNLEAPRGPIAGPAKFELQSNYPNPFNSMTTIRFVLHDAGRLKLSIYNITGQRIMELENDFKPAGSYRMQWDGKDGQGKNVASGIYFCRMLYNGQRQSTRLLLVK